MVSSKIRIVLNILLAAVMSLTVFLPLAYIYYDFQTIPPETEGIVILAHYYTAFVLLLAIPVMLFIQWDLAKSVKYFLPDTPDKAVYKLVIHIIKLSAAIAAAAAVAIHFILIRYDTMLIAGYAVWVWITLRIVLFVAGMIIGRRRRNNNPNNLKRE